MMSTGAQIMLTELEFAKCPIQTKHGKIYSTHARHSRAVWHRE